MIKIIKISLFISFLFSLGCKPKVAVYKVSCVGDSITFGHGIKNIDDTYPSQLGLTLGTKYMVKNYGRSGATLLKRGDMPYWKQIEYKNAMHSDPKIVVIMLGTNDTKTQNWQYREDYIKDYTTLIHQFKSLPTKPKIWICLPPPAFKEVWGIRDSIIENDMIPMIKTIAHQTHVPIIDNNTLFLDKPQYFPDYIHPNEAGAKLLAQNVAKYIKQD